VAEGIPDLERLTFHDDADWFDLSTLPEPHEGTVPRFVELDADLDAALERDAAAAGISVDDLIRARLKGAA
jgi:hypothetical protein